MTVSATRGIDELLLRGAVTDTYDYDAFGNKINSTGTTPNNYLYRGEQYDSDLGLYYLRARYMNPLTGRFMSRDPEDGDTTDPETLHKYLYVAGDPVNGIDPTGRFTATGGAFPIPAPTSPDYGPLRPVGAAEYGLVVGAISLGAVAGVKDFAQAVECTYEKLASAFTQITQKRVSLNQLVATGPCSYGAPDPCAEIEEKLQFFIGLVTRDYINLLQDVGQQYCFAYTKPPPPGYSTTWEGHLEAFKNDQEGLNRWIVKALVSHCKIPPGALELADSPPPVCPAGRIPR